MPAWRKGIVDYLDFANSRHHINALFDLDITNARKAVRNYKRKHRKNMFLTIYILYVFIQALDREREMLREIYKNNHFIYFDEIDMVFIIEKDINGEKVPTSKIFRNAASMSLEELSEAAVKAITSNDEWVMSKEKKFNPAKIVEKLPRFLRKMILWYILKYNPVTRKKIFGNVSFTALSLFNGLFGYGLPHTPQNLNLILGGIQNRPIFVKKNIEERVFQGATLTFNHDVVDGAVGVRFIGSFYQMVQEAWGLEEYLKEEEKVSATKPQIRTGESA